MAQNDVNNKQRAQTLLRKNLRATGLNQAAASNYQITDAYADKSTGNFLVYLQQAHLGIPVYNKISVFIFRNDSLIGKRTDILRIPEHSAENGNYSVNPYQAIRFAANHLSIPLSREPQFVRQDNSRHRFVYRATGFTRREINSDLVWLPSQDQKSLRLSWNVHLASDTGIDDWLVRVDAKTGEILSKSSYVVYEKPNDDCEDQPAVTPGSVPATGPALVGTAPLKSGLMGPPPPAVTDVSYRVFPFPLESGNFGSRSLESNPWTKAGAGNNATTLGWQFDNSNNYTNTRGNNVWAQQDWAGNDATLGFSDTSLTAIPTLSFDRPLDASASPSSYSNVRAGIDNLFYWNNIMHDISYQYGFDEAAGNFQADNQGRGGTGGDWVDAFAQDGSGINNSNFSTPPDGYNGIMRMYTFNYGQTISFHVNSPAAAVGTYNIVEGAVSYKSRLLNSGTITANIVRVNDQSNSNQACSMLTNAAELNGNIALITRGSCNYITKIKYAQNAGAIAVIVTNSVDGYPPTMGGIDTTITIPALMVSDTTGNKLWANITGLNGTLTATGQYSDGSLDNGVIAHEFTHGISNRLTGGPANADCLANAEQMGEGWSDYMALMVTTNWSTAVTGDGAGKRTLATYALAQAANGPGIRNYPYSTDMSINPWTYAMMAQTNGEAHSIGEIWCATLWDMTWNIITQEGIDADIYHGTKGNNIALQLVMTGMKYQPCSPGFIDGRNAILAADSLLYGYAHKCAIWNAFARRGMGVNASEGSSNNYLDGVADYTLPSGLSLAQTADKTTGISQGDHVTYTIKAYCDCSPLSNISIVDTLSGNLTYIASPGGTYTAPAIHFDGLSFAAGESKTFTIEAAVNGGYSTPDTLINDSRDPDAYSWTSTITTGSSQWGETTTRSHSPSHSWRAPDVSGLSDFAITTSDLVLDTLSTLSFWHYYETDPAYDGGVVEITTDNGATWKDLGNYITENGYTNALDPNTAGLANRRAFTGSTGGVFIRTTVSLTGFAGKTARIRFRFASDATVGSDGWYIDDIVLQNQSGALSLGTALSGATVLSRSNLVSALGPGSVNLPVTFIQFTARKNGSSALLQWTTGDESEVEGYDVQRSGDGAAFTTIGEVGYAAGGAYAYADAQPLTGNNFYRIAERDRDGKLTYSPVRLVIFTGGALTVTVAPVPTYTHTVRLSVGTAADDEPVQAMLVNPVGQVVKVFAIKQGVNTLNLGSLGSGVYYLRTITAKGNSEIQKIVIQ